MMKLLAENLWVNIDDLGLDNVPRCDSKSTSNSRK